MPDSRGARLALEAVFLCAVAGALAFADLRPLAIGLVMLVAWAIVALFEWAAWRERPHWASGAPPRYHVPEQPLPPRPAADAAGIPSEATVEGLAEELLAVAGRRGREDEGARRLPWSRGAFESPVAELSPPPPRHVPVSRGDGEGGR